ncbi:MAG: glycerol-3-phosphate dehydrogenase [Acidiferrobacteraceae bacterium]|nr:glycerol-3-phosphate dehydrogenase [Acidiferrobacteraceae bacterium]
MSNLETLAVLGAGSWGTALALLTARQARKVLLWDHSDKHIEYLQSQRCNVRYLPDFMLPENVVPTSRLSSVLNQTKKIVIAVPSTAFRSTLLQLRENISAQSEYHFCWGTKGLEASSGALMSEVFDDVIGQDMHKAILSGPSFAQEVAAGLPTAMTVASNRSVETESFAVWFRNDRTRIYTSEDLIGVQIGGAVKNVMAIASGVSDGLGFGSNARAALITRGLAEMIRLGVALGAQAQTFVGLTGIGDLVLTCTDDSSRNRRLGIGIGQGGRLPDVLNEIGQETEGLHSARAIHNKSKNMDIKMPITEQVYRILFENLDPLTAVQTLLSREAISETA